jgi:transposase
VIPEQLRIVVCTEPVDMRFGFDRLLQVVRDRMAQSPHGGGLFVFGNRRANRVKAVWLEPGGVCMLYKRGHRTSFQVPRGDGSSLTVRIDRRAFARLLAGVPRSGRKNDH